MAKEKNKYSAEEIAEAQAMLKDVRDLIKDGAGNAGLALAERKLKERVSAMRRGYGRYVLVGTFRKDPKTGSFLDRYANGSEGLLEEDDERHNYIYAKDDADAIRQLTEAMRSFEASSEDGGEINNRYILWKASDKRKPLKEADTRFYQKAAK
jgi:hypothetical protein